MTKCLINKKRKKRKAHKSSARLNEYQVNVKLTSSEYDEIQKVNDKFFAGELTPTQLGRLLFDVACDYLAKSKVEQKSVVLVNGLQLTEIK